ncbi:MAG: hypothetical protein Ct9H300mP13_7920 [Gammaproteobacteria bacterium]|nr:MAG: hypothetical protein Ct9H300mP13_7920 [Gammaproteobacteria bacterium]
MATKCRNVGCGVDVSYFFRGLHLSECLRSRALCLRGNFSVWQSANWRGIALHQHSFGGMGGRPGRDGPSAVSFPYNVRDVSIEWSEHETPVLYHSRELIPDSGGAGTFRGGLGQQLTFEAYATGTKANQPLVFSGAAGRMRTPPKDLGVGSRVRVRGLK